jgi:DNA-nicking Smr family endonuclease
VTRRRRGGLSEEDRALWARVAASARPLRAARDGRASLPQDGAPDAAAARAAAVAPAPAREPAAASAGLSVPAAEPAPRASLTLRPAGAPEPRVSWRLAPDDRPRPPSPSTPGLDKGTARRLARGRREPEARLDLHGMTADRAHAALTRFVGDGVARGLRCLLVVTGMGRSPEGGHRGDGVLRRETPRWLGVAPLSGHVVGVFEAHPRHGGAGALYVYLRRRR